MYSHINIVATFVSPEGAVAEQVFRQVDDTIVPDTKKPSRFKAVARTMSSVTEVNLNLYRSDISEDACAIHIGEWKSAETDIGYGWMRDCITNNAGLLSSLKRAVAVGKAKSMAEAIANVGGGIPVFSF